jgi:hypothetical protein
MTPFDDNDLIDRLQSAIAERQSGISLPDGIGDSARRTARKRTATRAVAAGVPVLAAAGVATVLAIGSVSGPTDANGLSEGGSSGSALSAPTGPVTAEDTAYIVKRVKAKVADDSQSRMVIHSYTYASGGVSSAGSLVNLGSEIYDSYDYVAADRTEYMRVAWNKMDGSPGLTGSEVLVPDGRDDGMDDDTKTLINPATHTYSQTQFADGSDREAGLSTPNLRSTSSQVQQALRTGRVTQKGMATVNGIQVIALSVAVPSADHLDLTLYVDAQTYQPLRTVQVYDGLPDLLVADWMPATRDNIAKATDDSIPAGYAKVNNVLAPPSPGRATRRTG